MSAIYHLKTFDVVFSETQEETQFFFISERHLLFFPPLPTTQCSFPIPHQSYVGLWSVSLSGLRALLRE